MQKIIFIHNNYEPDRFPRVPDTDDRYYTYGFGSHFARNFKYYFKEYDVEMWRIDSFTKEYNEKIVQGVKFKVFKSLYIRKLGDFSRHFIKELKKEVKKSNPILFISHTHTWLLYQIAFFLPESRIVTSHHGDWSPFFKLNERNGLRSVKDRLDISIEKRVFKNVNYFLVCDTKEIPYINSACRGGRVELFSTGIDIDRIIPVEKNKAREILGWDKNKKYILYLGQLYKYKQAKELIDLWKNLNHEDRNIELIVIGNSEKDEFYNYAKDAGVKTLGRILNKDLNMYYSASDVYVLLSLRDDYFGGIGIAPLESLACNTPVVSYSLRNYIGDNLYEIGEAPQTIEDYRHKILQVIQHPENYKNMRESIKLHYSYEAIAKKMEIVFKELSN